MAIILGANTLSGAFSVDNSCRFNDDDSAEMHKTPGGAGNQDAWTLSMWVKRGRLGTGSTQSLYGVYADGNNQETLAFDSGGTLDKLYWQMYQGGSVVGQLTTNRLFRDPSAWYNIVVSYNSAASATLRMRMWINGTEESSFTTDSNPSSGLNSQWNGTTKHQIGCITTANYFDGYMAEVVSLDGTAVTDATNFGEFNEDSPTIWQPIDVSGLTFGTNGFYLDFEDSSNLGNDKNGGTDLTEVNLAATDQTTDSPTNNFATWNGILNYSSTMSLAEGNIKGTTGSSHEAYFQSFFSSIGVTAGKWYAEFSTSAQSAHALIGISADMESDVRGSTDSAYSFIYKGQGIGYYGSNGKIFHTNSDTQMTYGTSYADDDIIGIALDMDNQEVYFSKNGTWQNSGDPTSGATQTGGVVDEGARNIFSTGTGTVFFAAADYDQSAQCVWEGNFGNPFSSISSSNADANGYGNFEYAVPSGYLALCTKNLGSDGG